MVSVELKGRLGNHLFQYAVCRIIAEKKGIDFSIPNNKPIGDKSVSGAWLGKKLFNCSLGVKYKRQPNEFKEKDNSYTPGIFNVPDNTHLNGWWQSEKYFSGWEDKIREWYTTPKPDLPFTNEEYCIIHYRAQDGYLTENYTPSDNFFKQSKEEIIKIKEDIKFIVITDNLKLAKQNFPNDIIKQHDMKTDFQIIQHSKYKIISNSSFSWWAAWLGIPSSILTIAPNRWMNYNYNKSKENIFYPNDIKTKQFKYI